MRCIRRLVANNNLKGVAAVTVVFSILVAGALGLTPDASTHEGGSRRSNLAVVVSRPSGATATPSSIPNEPSAPLKGLPASDTNVYDNTWTSHPNPPLPTSGPPGICGPWSAASSTQVQELRSTHGILNSCLLIDHYWVVTTEGVNGPAQLGVLDCSPTNSACLDGWRDKSFAAFNWYSAPPLVTQLDIALIQGELISMISNDGQWTFDLGTTAFARMGG